jgi:hypothetical protein
MVRACGAVLNKETVLEPYYCFDIPLLHHCVIAPPAWYPVKYIPIHVHLPPAVVCKQQIKVIKLQLVASLAG